MANRDARCGGCQFFDAEIDPTGKGTGVGFCSNLATKKAGTGLASPIGWVTREAPGCLHFGPRERCAAVEPHVAALLTVPDLPTGVELERAVEIQAGRCAREQGSLAVPSRTPRREKLDPAQLSLCRVQLTAALLDPQFYGRLTLVFAGGDARTTSLVGWKLRRFPKGGELQTA